jgi:hypothetical protein
MNAPFAKPFSSRTNRALPLDLAADSPSPLNGERAGVRGEWVRDACLLL